MDAESRHIHLDEDEFAELLSLHLKRGTRPLGDPKEGRPWGVKEFAHVVRVTPRTIGNWLNPDNDERTLPLDKSLIDVALFGKTPDEQDDSRRASREALSRAYDKAHRKMKVRSRENRDRSLRASSRTIPNDGGNSRRDLSG